MEKFLEDDKCCGCHACFNVCPKKAIEMVNDNKGFKHPIIDQDKCIDCNLCKKICPVLKSIEQKYNSVAYACYNKNNEERMNSSSGGIFVLIAKEIINRGGVVFGASYDSDYIVKHVEVSSIEELPKLMGSKYVQSIIGDTYKRAKELLEKDMYVLFTGMPCQIEGLKSFLIKDYPKLITQDIICHGVPSAKVWEKYKNYRREIDNNKKPVSISFRSKEHGWTSYDIKFSYDKNTYSVSHKDDFYMQAFLWDISLMDACFDCHFKKKNRISDITLGDYWGVENIHKDLFDDKGTSLVIIHSNKGVDLFNSIKHRAIYEKTDLDTAISYNSAMICSTKPGKNREKFFSDIENYDFDKLVKKHVEKYGIKWRCKLKIKNFVKRLIKKEKK